MFNPSMYLWFDRGYYLPEGSDENQAKEVFKSIDKKDWSNAKKNLIGRYYLELLKEGNSLDLKTGSDLNKEFRSWIRSSSFEEFKNKILKQDVNRFIISGLVIVMTGTLVFFFLTAILTQNFVIHFSIDAIFASLAGVFLARNLAVKYKLIKRYTNPLEYIEGDIVSVVLCICLKLMIPKFLDMSLAVLFAVHVFQKSRFQKILNNIKW